MYLHKQTHNTQICIKCIYTLYKQKHPIPSEGLCLSPSDSVIYTFINPILDI